MVRAPLSLKKLVYLDGQKAVLYRSRMNPFLGRNFEAMGSQLAVEAAPTKRRCPPSWARLISKVYQADPLVCKGYGGPLRIVAYITDEPSIRRILDHLGLSPPEQEKTPPTREVVRVPVDDEGREIQAG
jgi:hypothetical protein